MNYFFGLKNETIKSELQIPLFQNRAPSNLDVQVFDRLRKRSWFIAPITSSILGSITDTFLFFSIAFYLTGVPWVSLALGDLAVKIFIAITMLIPFRLLINKIKDFSESSTSKANS